MKIAFIGSGNMANALISGLIQHGTAPTDLYAIDTDDAARARTHAQFGIQTHAAVSAALLAYDAIVLAVKPQILKEVARLLAPHLSTQLVISVAAGIRNADLSRWLNGYSYIVRAMPNTPALIGMSITGLAALASVSKAQRTCASQILNAVGKTVWFDDEAQIDAVTAISGSGPAYVFYFIEALQEAARQLGLDMHQSRALAVATFAGAAQLAAQSDEPADALRQQVTSKGGTTAAALADFDKLGVKDKVIHGVLAAHARAQEMGNEYGKQ